MDVLVALQVYYMVPLSVDIQLFTHSWPTQKARLCGLAFKIGLIWIVCFELELELLISNSTF